MKKAFIFDLDGVLCFTDRYHYTAWKTVADKIGIPFDEKVNDRLRGVSRMESLNIILSYSDRHFEEAEKERIAAEKNGLYRELLARMTPSDVSDSVRDTLERLKSDGFRLAVGSSSKNTPLILARTGLAGYFDVVSDGNNITRSKPDPEVFQKAAAMLGLSPDECYIVEDAEAGIDAGVAGGFTTIGIGPAAAYRKTDIPIRDFSELTGIAQRADNR